MSNLSKSQISEKLATYYNNHGIDVYNATQNLLAWVVKATIKHRVPVSKEESMFLARWQSQATIYLHDHQIYNTDGPVLLHTIQLFEWGVLQELIFTQLEFEVHRLRL